MSHVFTPCQLCSISPNRISTFPADNYLTMKLNSTQIAAVVKKKRENIASRSNVTPISIRQKQSTIDPIIKPGITTCISKINITVQQNLAKEAKILLLGGNRFFRTWE